MPKLDKFLPHGYATTEPQYVGAVPPREDLPVERKAGVGRVPPPVERVPPIASSRQDDTDQLQALSRIAAGGVLGMGSAITVLHPTHERELARNPETCRACPHLDRQGEIDHCNHFRAPVRMGLGGGILRDGIIPVDLTKPAPHWCPLKSADPGAEDTLALAALQKPTPEEVVSALRHLDAHDTIVRFETTPIGVYYRIGKNGPADTSMNFETAVVLAAVHLGWVHPSRR